MKGCSASKNGKCSWIKVEDWFSCVSEKTADFCDFYANEEGYTESIHHVLCVWNKTTKKCSGGTKSCLNFSSIKACATLNDECFWNDFPSPSQGQCLSLEETYKCSNLCVRLCGSRYNVKELIVEDEPCFFNGVNSEAFECVSVENVVNSTCENIKTNGMEGGSFNLHYCDHAQFLFSIDGKKRMGYI
jgi:hypothetical protein